MNMSYSSNTSTSTNLPKNLCFQISIAAKIHKYGTGDLVDVSHLLQDLLLRESFLKKGSHQYKVLYTSLTIFVASGR